MAKKSFLAEPFDHMMALRAMYSKIPVMSKEMQRYASEKNNIIIPYAKRLSELLEEKKRPRRRAYAAYFDCPQCQRRRRSN